jgi:hypothetical protein
MSCFRKKKRRRRPDSLTSAFFHQSVSEKIRGVWEITGPEG